MVCGLVLGCRVQGFRGLVLAAFASGFVEFWLVLEVVSLGKGASTCLPGIQRHSYGGVGMYCWFGAAGRNCLHAIAIAGSRWG